MHQRHHVVIPAHMALQDFASTGVGYMRTVCIGNRACQVTDNAETRILHRHCAIVLGPLFTSYGILEACFLESLLPVVYTGYQILAPLLWSSRIDVIYNRLLGLNQFTLTHLLQVSRILRLKTIARDQYLAVNTLLLVVKGVETLCKVAHARIIVSRHHQLLGKHHERNVQAKGQLARSNGTRQALAAGIICLDQTYLGVRGESLDVLDIAQPHHRSSEFQRFLQALMYS